MIEAARGKAVETAALLETVEKRLRGCRPVKPRPVFPPLPQGLENAGRVSHSSHRFYYWDKTKAKDLFPERALALPWKNRRRFSHRMPHFPEASDHGGCNPEKGSL
jgi:hypothetical protein